MDSTLTPQQLRQLFDKFSFPLVKSAITEHQKKVSIGIAKILWLSLVKCSDTEKNIYSSLSQILNNSHERIIAVGSLYFYKMKTVLTEEEIKMLCDHYNINENFNNLENWIDEIH